LLLQPGIIQTASREAAEAVESVLEAYRAGDVEQEAAFTDRMLQAIVQRMRDYASGGYRWTAKTFTDRGPGAQEKVLGADFMGVFSVQSPDFSVVKAFLAQAKRLEPGRALDSEELGRLKNQCDKMLQRTPDSFVFIYSRAQVIVVPAISVIAYSGGDLHALHKRRLAQFLEEHFACFIGDRFGGHLRTDTDQAIIAAMERAQVSRAFRLKAASADYIEVRSS